MRLAAGMPAGLQLAAPDGVLLAVKCRTPRGAELLVLDESLSVLLHVN